MDSFTFQQLTKWVKVLKNGAVIGAIRYYAGKPGQVPGWWYVPLHGEPQGPPMTTWRRVADTLEGKR